MVVCALNCAAKAVSLVRTDTCILNGSTILDSQFARHGRKLALSPKLVKRNRTKLWVDPFHGTLTVNNNAAPAAFTFNAYVLQR